MTAEQAEALNSSDPAKKRFRPSVTWLEITRFLKHLFAGSYILISYAVPNAVHSTLCHED